MKKVALSDTVFVESSRKLCVEHVHFRIAPGWFWQGKSRKVAKNACKNGLKYGDHKMSLKAKYKSHLSKMLITRKLEVNSKNNCRRKMSTSNIFSTPFFKTLTLTLTGQLEIFRDFCPFFTCFIREFSQFLTFKPSKCVNANAQYTFFASPEKHRVRNTNFFHILARIVAKTSFSALNWWIAV